MNRLPFLLALSLAVAAPSPSRAASRRQLEARLAELRREITAQTARLDPLVLPWLEARDLSLDLSAEPILSLLRSLNDLPASARTTHAAITDHSGQLAGDDWDCWIFGDGGWFVEFADPGLRAVLDLPLSNVRAVWVPGRGPRLDIDLAAEATIGRLRLLIDPCLGGGFFIRFGPASCRAGATLTATATLGPLHNGGISYQLRASASNVRTQCVLNIGVLPDPRFSLDRAMPSAELRLDGVVDLPLEQSGAVTVPLPSGPAEKRYRLRLAEPQAGPTDRGIAVATDIVLEWLP
jgi:hypothetical protein